MILIPIREPGHLVHKRHLVPALSGIVLALTTAMPASALHRPTVTDLGTLGGDVTFALDINDRGQVTGNSRTADGRLSAFRWEGGRMFDIGFLPGGNGFSRGYAVNDRGVVVGESDNNRPRAFRWQGGVLTDVGTLAGGSTAVAHDVNRFDRTVGGASNGTATRPFVATRSSGPVDLGTLAGSTTSSGRAWAINDRGDVVGLSRNQSDTTSQATLWPKGEPGSAVNLGSLDGTQFSQAYAVNDRRWAVGESTTATGDGHAVLWRDHRAPQDLGTLGFRHSRANDVSRRGEVVGHVTSLRGSPTTDGRAVIWRGTGWTDLNGLLPAGTPWTLLSAEGINDRGQVVGFGRLNGQLRSFLLNLPR